MPVFPDILPSSIQESNFRNLEFGDIKALEELKYLLLLLFREKECNFYYFFAKDIGPIDKPLQMSKNNGDILMQDRELFYFKHPEHDRVYIKIEVRDGKYEFDWQKNVVEKGPMYTRYKLQLSDRKRTVMETLQKIELEEQIRKARSVSMPDINTKEDIIDLKPNCFGVGINLNALVRKWKSIIKKK